MSTAALSRSLHILTKRTNSDSSQKGNISHAVYFAALRCCLFPVLEARSAGTSPEGCDHHHFRGKHYIRRAAGHFGELFGLQLAEGTGSTIRDDAVILSPQTLKKFRSIVVELVKRSKLEKNPDHRPKAIAAAGGRLLDERLQGNFSPALIANVKDLIFVIGEYIDQELRDLPPDEHDKYLFLTARVFMTCIRDAIYKAEPTSTVLSHPVLKDEEQLKPIFATLIKGDSNASLSNWLRVIFDVRKEDHNLSIAEVRKGCNEKIAFAELKAYVDSIACNQCAGSLPSDFQSKEAYETWKHSETKILMGLMKAFAVQFPNAQAQRTGANVDCFLPPDPRRYYRVLLQTCLKHDIQSSTNGEVALSKLSKSVLSECALRWRLTREFKEIALLDLLVTNYRLGAVLLGDLFPKFQAVTKWAMNAASFRQRDRQYYLSILEQLHEALMACILRFWDLASNSSDPAASNATMQLICLILQMINEDPTWAAEHPDQVGPGKLEEAVKYKISLAVNERYCTSADVIARSVQRDVIRATLRVKNVNQQLNKYRLYFKDPLFGKFSIMLAAGTCLTKNFLLEMEKMQFLKKGDFQLAEMLELYQVVRLLYDLCEESELTYARPKDWVYQAVTNFDVESWFAPFIQQWLTVTDQKWIDWVKSAVDLEKYHPTLPPTIMASSSVLDLFTCFNSGLDFIEKLGWRDGSNKDRLVKDFIKMMSKALQKYASMMYAEFERMHNEVSDKPRPFSFESCVKVNNILTAISKLREILNQLIANEAISKIDPNALKTEPTEGQGVIHIKIIKATNLIACDWTTSDPYVTLSLGTEKLHRTRVIDKDLNPVWNESCQIHLPDSLEDNNSFLELAVFDKDLVGDDLCGSTRLYLRDSKFNDFLSHDIELNLKPQGKLYLRVVREGEIDDKAFWVRKAEETLTFCLEDMLRVYSEQICRIARPIFSQVAQPSTAKSIFNFSFSSSSTSTPTDSQIESSFRNFFEFLDENLGLLNENLDRALNAYMVARIPSLAPLKEKDKKGKTGADAAPGVGVGATGGGADSATMETNEPTIMAKIIYHDLLSMIHNTLTTFGAEEKDKAERKKGKQASTDVMEQAAHLSSGEKQATAVYEVLVGMLKTLFWCEGGTSGGYTLEELEGPNYVELMKVLNAYMKQ
ncbi:hypothetical protein HK104_010843 [Borealophlyctis nickersoniae]|nr:hypothetical protein HK104_010843 [Borealophlyctis nickersoniae]